jgi:hypothetical protein
MAKMNEIDKITMKNINFDSDVTLNCFVSIFDGIDRISDLFDSFDFLNVKTNDNLSPFTSLFNNDNHLATSDDLDEMIQL